MFVTKSESPNIIILLKSKIGAFELTGPVDSIIEIIENGPCISVFSSNFGSSIFGSNQLIAVETPSWIFCTWNGLSFSSNLSKDIIVTYERNKHKIEDIIAIIQNEGVEIIDISTEDGDLEDVFIQLTKN